MDRKHPSEYSLVKVLGEDCFMLDNQLILTEKEFYALMDDVENA